MILPRGGAIGILGGGQLGRMLATAAARLGFDAHIFTPEPDSPAGRAAASETVATYEDETALAAFAARVDVITFEFENVPAATVDLLAALKPVRPGAAALAASQDRLAEKRLLETLGLAPAPYAAVDTREELHAAYAALGPRTILKTRRFGYDGKGQVRLTEAEAIDAAWSAIAGRPAILEGHVPFRLEVSAIVARGIDGAVTAYDPPENIHAEGMLRESRVPAAIPAALAAEAIAGAARLAAHLDYVGVLALEYFVTDEGRLIANEFAPRVHNSGHWTEAVCAAGQFEQHIRAVAGWPLGSTARRADATMHNLIGAEVDEARAHAGDPNAVLTLYGKREAAPGRKMGHVTIVGKAVHSEL